MRRAFHLAQQVEDTYGSDRDVCPCWLEMMTADAVSAGRGCDMADVNGGWKF
jgi:hypothetical protein